MWIEVDDDGYIMGIHTHKCESNLNWHEVSESVTFNDRYKDGQIVQVAKAVELDLPERQRQANIHVNKYYTPRQQITVLRKNIALDLEKMNRFLDHVETWVANDSAILEDLRNIEP